MPRLPACRFLLSAFDNGSPGRNSGRYSDNISSIANYIPEEIRKEVNNPPACTKKSKVKMLAKRDALIGGSYVSIIPR
jgi:hypothetical protein